MPATWRILFAALLFAASDGRRTDLKAVQELAQSEEHDADAVADASLGANASVASRLAAGHLFDGRWLLQRKLGRFPGSIKGALRSRWSSARKVGRGSFGEAWEATGDVAVGGRMVRKTVVLKIFYRNQGQGPDAPVTYLTPGNLRRAERGEVKSIQTECAVVANIQAAAGAAGDVGEDRFVSCYEFVSGKSNEPLYVVLGRGGQSLDKYITSQGPRQKPVTASSLRKARKIVANILQAIRTMGENLPVKMTHHDLKPANAVFDGTTARLIDFGGVLEVGGRNQRVCATPAYSPPEHLGLRGAGAQVPYAMPAWSYDMFAVGMMYAELMCPPLTILGFGHLVNYARSANKQARRPFGHYCNVPELDIHVMETMMAFRAKDRPSPSWLLKQAPFAELAGEIGERAQQQLRFREADAAVLKESVAVAIRNRFHRNEEAIDIAQAQRAKEKGREWVHGYQCERFFTSLKDAFTDLQHDTRKQCAKACRRHYSIHRATLEPTISASGEPTKFCCDLVYDYPSMGNRACAIGYGGTIPSARRVGGAWAIEIPISDQGLGKDGPVAPRKLRVPGGVRAGGYVASPRTPGRSPRHAAGRSPRREVFVNQGRGVSGDVKARQRRALAVSKEIQTYKGVNWQCKKRDANGWEIPYTQTSFQRPRPQGPNVEACQEECKVKVASMPYSKKACCEYTFVGRHLERCFIYESGDSEQVPSYSGSYNKRIVAIYQAPP